MNTADNEWRVRLLEVLGGVAISQPRDADQARRRMRFGWVVAVAAALLMLGVAFDQACDVHVESPGILAQVRSAGITDPQFLLEARLMDVQAREDAEKAVIFRRRILFVVVAGLAHPLLVFIATYAQSKAARTLAPDAFAELDRLPDRRPVVFLRSFSRDPSDKTGLSGFALGDFFEQVVVKELHDRAPVIAVGKPGERLPPLGAGRFYVGPHVWQLTVTELLSACQLVLWVYGATEGLVWELSTVVAQGDPLKLIICIPKEDESSQSKRAAWKRFLDLTAEVFPKPLPDDPGRALFLRFDQSWNPVLVGPSSRLSYVGSRAIRRALRASTAS